MNPKAAFFAAATAGAFLLLSACGGGGSDGSSSSTQSQPDPSSSGGSASSGGSSSGSSGGGGGNTGSCQAQIGPAPSRQDISSSFDAPLVFLAQPGPITATLLASPPNNPPDRFGFGAFYFFFGSNGNQTLGIGDSDSVGKSVTTAPILNQPTGVPLIFGAVVDSIHTAEGASVMTGWIDRNNVTCCADQPKVRAQVSFGANNTAIVTFGGPSRFLPDSWTNNPLRIQLTNVAACSM